MTRFLLPTADIVREHLKFEDHFCFYDEGVKGVIRDIVLFSDTGGGFLLPVVKDTMLEKVLQEYDCCFGICYHENTLPPDFPDYPPLSTIELLTEAMTEAVFGMLQGIFLHAPYVASWNVADYEWFGHDLIAPLEILEKPNVAGHYHPRLLCRTSSVSKRRL